MAEWLGRFMNALSVGIAAYNEKNTVPVREWGWTDYRVRLARYWLYNSYNNNTAYSSIENHAAQLKFQNRLYKKIRGIYNPVARQNQILTSYIYGGAIDFEHMTGGAIPIVGGDDRLHDALRTGMQDSRWGENKSLYARWAALLGDVALKVVDDRERQIARLEVLHPGKIREAEFDDVGNVKAVIIEYEREEQPDIMAAQPGRFGLSFLSNINKSYTYTEKITKESFSTFKNGEPFAFYPDASGKLVSEWDNEYGFVPVVIANYSPSGIGGWGVNSFYNVLHKIDEINDQASLLNDQIRNTIVPLLKAMQIKKSGDIEFDSDERDQLKMIYLPNEGMDIEPIVTDINIHDAADNIASMLMEIERDLSVLSLQRIREHGQLTAPGVKMGYSDAIGTVIEARGNLDPAFVRGFQMLIKIAGEQGYEGYQGYNLNSEVRGDIEFSVGERPVIGDSISKAEKIQTLQSLGDQPIAIQKLILKELDYSDEAIEEVIVEQEEANAAKERNAVRALMQGIFTDDETDDDEADVVDGTTPPAQLPAPVVNGAAAA